MTTVWTGTYRLQMHKEFPLDAAVKILPYLKSLGISHVYLSPCLQAAPGSTHGYDVTDPTQINQELGGESAWQEFVHHVKALGLRLLLDIVPNHMSASADNPWWDNLLAHGPYSPYAEYFDLRLENNQPFRVQVCSLGKSFGDALEAGEITLEMRNDTARVRYFDNSWPVAPAAWGSLIPDESRNVDGRPRRWSHDLVELHAIARPSVDERARYHDACARGRVAMERARRDGSLERTLSAINADPARLAAVLDLQFYTLHTWKLAGELGNYRRFFDVDSLVGMRTERLEVFEATHARILKMIANEELDGLRIDHPDGLRDPAGYFERLRQMLPKGRIYIEKILENDERLDSSWAVDGTVGYDFLSKVNRLWMDDQQIDALTATYSDFTHQSVNISAVVRQKKRDIIASSFPADLNRLSAAVLLLAKQHWQSRDLSPTHLHHALAALTVALPLYRTYRTAGQIAENDYRIVTDAIQRARIAAPDVEPAAFDFLLALFTKPTLKPEEADFVSQWQQLAPAVMAKGVEDTTFYCYDRLLSCNEVGASASLVGISTDKFHEYCHYLSEQWPSNQLTTSTHDNKRSEDVRTRISILSEIPEKWAEALHQWSQLTEPSWKGRTPDRHAEYLLYQTLIGAWPLTKERAWQYMLKASREAKIRTSWHEPNVGYEANIQSFTEGVFDNPEFLASLEAFITPLILPGRINSLAQTLIKMVVPGVPDFYQGSELWDLSLVDPDNRRPVDYAERQKLLARCATTTARETLEDWDSGLPKLWMTSRLLTLRHERAEAFGPKSKYHPLVAQGSRLGNLFAFRRGQHLIAVVPRFTTTVADAWDDTHLPLPDGQWLNVFTGSRVENVVVPDVEFADFPVALLVRA
jgi:(1->4)-alpha-D-glucan 1-alpha-D-glucosylmutase